MGISAISRSSVSIARRFSTSLARTMLTTTRAPAVFPTPAVPPPPPRAVLTRRAYASLSRGRPKLTRTGSARGASPTAAEGRHASVATRTFARLSRGTDRRGSRRFRALRRGRMRVAARSPGVWSECRRETRRGVDCRASSARASSGWRSRRRRAVARHTATGTPGTSSSSQRSAPSARTGPRASRGGGRGAEGDVVGDTSAIARTAAHRRAPPGVKPRRAVVDATSPAP